MKQKKPAQFHINLTLWQEQRLNEIASKLNITRSVLIRVCLNKCLKELNNALLSNKQIIIDFEELKNDMQTQTQNSI